MKNTNQDEVIQNKKKSIKSLNSLLEDYINSGKEELLKKANLISYWILGLTLVRKWEDYILRLFWIMIVNIGQM